MPLTMTEPTVPSAFEIASKSAVELRDLIRTGDILKGRGALSSKNYHSWREQVDRVLDRALGPSHPAVKAVRKINADGLTLRAAFGGVSSEEHGLSLREVVYERLQPLSKC